MIYKSNAWTATRDVFLLVASRMPDALSLACASAIGLLITIPFADFPVRVTLLFAHLVLWGAAVVFLQRMMPPGRPASWRTALWGLGFSAGTAATAILFALVALSRGIPDHGEVMKAINQAPSLIATIMLAPGAVYAGRRLLRTEIERELPDRDMARRNEEALSVIFHELRRPLTVLVASSEMALDPDATEEERNQLLQSVHRQALRLGSYLEELLECSRIQASRLRLARRPVNLSNLVEEVATEFRDGFNSPIHFTFPKDAPVFVSGDVARLKMIMRNLISNAIKYSPVLSPVEVSMEVHGARAIVNIDDEGPGIPEGYRSQVFEQYFRLPGSAPGGFGLGLYLSRQLIKAHNGDIKIEDAPTGGARFIVSLPALAATMLESGVAGRSPGAHPFARSGSK
jgi:signal transduction histidine kinase